MKKIILLLILSVFILFSCVGTIKIKDIKKIDKMVYIPGGFFYMSTTTGNEKLKKIYLKSFYMDIYEVSNADYAKFYNAGGYRKSKYWSEEGWQWKIKNKIKKPKWWESGRYNIGPRFPDNPVAGVSWYEASAYAQWAGKRLPTEAEWEKASRGVDKRRFPWGNDDIHYEVVYYGNFETYNDKYMYSCPVKKFVQGKGPYGCFNMLGNVWEWLSDWHTGYDYYKTMPLKNPTGPSAGKKKLLRGGSWFKDPSYYESHFRYAENPGARKYDDFGFRCAVDAD
ncbi:MAG: SUMF1/EgtB/PvdO family nonheme iron enzyme [Spirochaetes bacterium]|nr:SUMF1/EgtB/PvdO family nonheme iron enzyme [Spirochaetota bacterium]